MTSPRERRTKDAATGEALRAPGGPAARSAQRGGARLPAALVAAAVVPAAAILVLGLLLALRAPSGDASGAVVGRPAPHFELVDFDGNPIRLSDLHGRPVVVNFWASWCPPCVEEFPRLARAVDEHADEGLVVIGVVYQDRLTSAREFMEATGATWPGAMDPGGTVASAYGIYGAPETFFIDRDGVIAARQIGPFSDEALERHLARIVPERDA